MYVRIDSWKSVQVFCLSVCLYVSCVNHVNTLIKVLWKSLGFLTFYAFWHTFQSSTQDFRLFRNEQSWKSTMFGLKTTTTKNTQKQHTHRNNKMCLWYSITSVGRRIKFKVTSWLALSSDSAWCKEYSYQIWTLHLIGIKNYMQS